MLNLKDRTVCMRKQQTKEIVLQLIRGRVVQRQIAKLDNILESTKVKSCARMSMQMSRQSTAGKQKSRSANRTVRAPSPAVVHANAHTLRTPSPSLVAARMAALPGLPSREFFEQQETPEYMHDSIQPDFQFEPHSSQLAQHLKSAD